jgi:hypothetical protein
VHLPLAQHLGDGPYGDADVAQIGGSRPGADSSEPEHALAIDAGNAGQRR